MASTSKGKQRAAAQDVEDEHPKFKEVPPAFFQAATILRILESGFKKDDGAMQISAPALKMTAEYIRLFTLEAIHRSAESLQADPRPAKGDQGDGQPVMDVKYLHQNAASLTLDFGV